MKNYYHTSVYRQRIEEANTSKSLSYQFTLLYFQVLNVKAPLHHFKLHTLYTFYGSHLTQTAAILSICNPIKTNSQTATCHVPYSSMMNQY